MPDKAQQSPKTAPTERDGETAISRFFKSDNFVTTKLFPYFFKASKQQRKRQIQIGSLIIGAYLIYRFLMWGFAPFIGGMDFGMCKVFLELQVQYPQTIRYSTVQNFSNSIRIWYSQLDAYGDYRMEAVQCYYRADPVTGAALEKVTINRREIDPDIVDKFNKSIPAVVSFPPDLAYPRDFPDRIKDLQIKK